MENGAFAAQLLGTTVDETPDGPTYSYTRRFGAVFRHAAIRACLTVAVFASRNWMIVDPRRPHAPLAGRKTSGSARMKDSRSSGFSLTIPQSSSEQKSKRETGLALGPQSSFCHFWQYAQCC
jgi:hypothetical protein